MAVVLPARPADTYSEGVAPGHSTLDNHSFPDVPGRSPRKAAAGATGKPDQQRSAIGTGGTEYPGAALRCGQYLLASEAVEVDGLWTFGGFDPLVDLGLPVAVLPK